MTNIWIALLVFAPVLSFAADGPPDDPPCSRRLEESGDDFSDAAFAHVAGEGIDTISRTGHVVAQVWRMGPRTALVIARLRLLDPALDSLGLVVAARVKNGVYDGLEELDPRHCFGLTRDGAPDFEAISNLDKNVRGHVTTFLREKYGVARTAVESTLGSKVMAGRDLSVMVRTAYLRDGKPVRRTILVKISSEDGVRLEEL